MNFKKLRIYKKALDLVVIIYQLINDNPKLAKDFAIVDQLKRAVISVVLNIAEGNIRTIKVSKNYLKISIGSCNETEALLEIINGVYHIKTDHLINEYEILAKQISAFIKSFK